ncbi:hypothetical protein Vafri_9118 [Volvox africanus]|uniref:Transposase DDE domain-containing protein n=1 Tax=Volvox africanus TaxID=51714 RepID=A0A8J4EZG0_9CHLO|nr:hypothetical protein Vafri_9118 [Volvox africanus]
MTTLMYMALKVLDGLSSSGVYCAEAYIWLALNMFHLELMRNYRNLVSYIVHYDRFVILIKFVFPALVCLLKTLEGTVTAYLFIDATPMAVCHNLREKRHKVR